MTISRRTSLAMLALAAINPAWAQSGQSAKDAADIARIEAYLNGIKTLKASFVQIAPSGASSTGKLWMERPGRMRFEYDPPSPLLLVAGHGLVVYHNSQLDQTSNIPLDKTPLGILLQDNLKLSGDVSVIRVARDPGAIALVLDRTASPGDGSLTLLFADNPLELRGWILHDAQGQETRIALDNLDFGSAGFTDDMFTYVDPKLFQNNAP